MLAILVGCLLSWKCLRAHSFDANRADDAFVLELSSSRESSFWGVVLSLSLFLSLCLSCLVFLFAFGVASRRIGLPPCAESLSRYRPATRSHWGNKARDVPWLEVSAEPVVGPAVVSQSCALPARSMLAIATDANLPCVAARANVRSPLPSRWALRTFSQFLS